MSDRFDLEGLKQLTENCHEVTIMFFTKEGRPLEGSDSNGSPTLMAALLGRIESLRRELATVRHYMNGDNEATVDEAMARGEFLDIESYDHDPSKPYGQLYVSEATKRFLNGGLCKHEWVDATNEVIEGGEVCTKCFAIRATPVKNVCARCRTTVSGVWSHLDDPNQVYCWTCWSQATEKTGDGPGAMERMREHLGPTDEDIEALRESTVQPDAGAELVLKSGEDNSIDWTKPTVPPNPLPNPVLLCECCADRGKWWKFNPHCDKCNQTGWSDKGVWAKDRDHKETEYAMDLSMYLCSFMRERASEIAVRLAFHIEQTTTYTPDSSKLIDQVIQGDTRRVNLLEAFAGTSEDRGTRDKGLIMFPDGSIRGALPGDTVEQIGQTVREAIDLCAHEPRPAERDYVEGRTSDG